MHAVKEAKLLAKYMTKFKAVLNVFKGRIKNLCPL